MNSLNIRIIIAIFGFLLLSGCMEKKIKLRENCSKLSFTPDAVDYLESSYQKSSYQLTLNFITGESTLSISGLITYECSGYSIEDNQLLDVGLAVMNDEITICQYKASADGTNHIKFKSSSAELDVSSPDDSVVLLNDSTYSTFQNYLMDQLVSHIKSNCSN